MEQRTVVSFLTLTGFKAKEIEMELTGMYGDAVLQISAVNKWRTRFLEGKTELGNGPRSGRPANSDCTQAIAELIREHPFLNAKYYSEISGSRKRHVSEFFTRNSGPNVSSSMDSTPAHPEQNMKASRVAMSHQLLEILQPCQARGFVHFLTGDESWLFLEYPNYGALSCRGCVQR
jgi:transposase